MTTKGTRKPFCYMGHRKSGRNLRIRTIRGGKYIEWGCRLCDSRTGRLRYWKAKLKTQTKQQTEEESHGI
jgi:hypothetical protein